MELAPIAEAQPSFARFCMQRYKKISILGRFFLLFSENRSKSLFLQNKSDDVKGLVRTLTMADAVQLSAHTVAVRFGFLWYFGLDFCGIWLLLFASCIIQPCTRFFK